MAWRGVAWRGVAMAMAMAMALRIGRWLPALSVDLLGPSHDRDESVDANVAA